MYKRQSHACATGAWPPRGRNDRGAGGGGGGAPPWPKANAPARAPPPPLVIDGALLRELLDLPADAQREVLTDAIDVEASDGEEEGDEVLKERRSPRERGRMGTSHDAVEGSRRSAPALPVEAVLGVIQRVLEP